MNVPITPYDTIVPTRRRPTTPADLHRLADLARARGIRLYQEATTGAWFATSATKSGAVYYVTGLSCTCEGFCYVGRCSHHSALLARLGWLPDVADAAPTPALCPGCKGRGWVYVEDGDWPAQVPCRTCTTDLVALAAD